MMGQSVQLVKDNVSKDLRRSFRHNLSMPVWNEELEFNEQFQARIRGMREAREWTAAQMATALGIPADNYRKYETRSMMPHYLLPRLAQIHDCDLEYLLTGKSSSGRKGPRRVVRTGTDG